MFAFNPDDRPARIMRYVEHGTLPTASLVSIYVHEENLLIIDKKHFARLTAHEKRSLLRTQSSYHETTEFEAFRQQAA